MEQIKAVKSVFHKSCFRCAECNKQLKYLFVNDNNIVLNSNSNFTFFSVDSYSSHEGIIYCKPHFKQLFQPKAVFENGDCKSSTYFCFFYLFTYAILFPFFYIYRFIFIYINQVYHYRLSSF